MPKKILVVDDEQEIVEIFAKKLRAKGFDVITAFSGEEALEKVKMDLPHLIILDIRLPGIDGTRVLELLKEDETTKDIPVLFVTAVNAPREIVRHFELGAENYLLKPISPKVLLGEVEEILVAR